MTLSMAGHIDQVFKSVEAVRVSNLPGAYVNGLFVKGAEKRTPHDITLQPVSDDELKFLEQGGERRGDVRKIYINSGNLAEITIDDRWLLNGVEGEFKSIKMDNRHWRDYCKVIVSAKDD